MKYNSRYMRGREFFGNALLFISFVCHQLRYAHLNFISIVYASVIHHSVLCACAHICSVRIESPRVASTVIFLFAFYRFHLASVLRHRCPLVACDNLPTRTLTLAFPLSWPLYSMCRPLCIKRPLIRRQLHIERRQSVRGACKRRANGCIIQFNCSSTGTHAPATAYRPFDQVAR